jgi:hypothetical protein
MGMCGCTNRTAHAGPALDASVEGVSGHLCKHTCRTVPRCVYKLGIRASIHAVLCLSVYKSWVFVQAYMP